MELYMERGSLGVGERSVLPIAVKERIVSQMTSKDREDVMERRKGDNTPPGG